jgi:hypothetical protein
MIRPVPVTLTNVAPNGAYIRLLARLHTARYCRRLHCAVQQETVSFYFYHNIRFGMEGNNESKKILVMSLLVDDAVKTHTGSQCVTSAS